MGVDTDKDGKILDRETLDRFTAEIVIGDDLLFQNRTGVQGTRAPDGYEINASVFFEGIIDFF